MLNTKRIIAAGLLTLALGSPALADSHDDCSAARKVGDSMSELVSCQQSAEDYFASTPQIKTKSHYYRILTAAIDLASAGHGGLEVSLGLNGNDTHFHDEGLADYRHSQIILQDLGKYDNLAPDAAPIRQDMLKTVTKAISVNQ
jgi:hypothetical protein